MSTSIAVKAASGQQFIDLPFPLKGRIYSGTPALVSFSSSELQAMLPVNIHQQLDITSSTAAAADASWVANVPDRATAFGSAGTTIVAATMAAQVTLTASTAATGADDVTIATAIPYGMQITRVRMVVTTTGTAGDTCTVRTATAAGGTAVSIAMACSAATAVDGTLTTTIPALATAGSLYVRRTGNKMAGTIVLEFLPLV